MTPIPLPTVKDLPGELEVGFSLSSYPAGNVDTAVPPALADVAAPDDEVPADFRAAALVVPVQDSCPLHLAVAITTSRMNSMFA